jgi:tetraacyldisaccharide 4'-kinase
MQRWLERIWYGTRPPPWWLKLLSHAFLHASALRQSGYRSGSKAIVQLPRPVIVVGNISVGGTGKTPLVIWLVRQLQDRGFRPGVVLRGYGGGSSGPLLVRPDSRVDEIGDEAALLRQRCGAPIAVGSDRVAAARLLLEAGANLIVADDGLQHLRLARQAEVAVIDGQRGFGNGWLLPAGPLRELPARLEKVSAVVQNGAGPLYWAKALPMRLEGATLLAVDGSGRRLGLTELAGARVHALAAIGNPERFFATLRAAGLDCVEHRYPDHYALQGPDICFEDALPVLMTEKDAVKCRPFAQAQHWYLPVTAAFEPADAQALLRRIFMNKRLLDILACPLCKGPLLHDRDQDLLVCRADRLAFPIRDGVPIMLQEEARILESSDPLLVR